jgi:hypothetical protein
MTYRLGRLVDHVHSGPATSESSRRFYRALFGVLGVELDEGAGYLTADGLYVPADGEPTRGLHLAFQAANRGAHPSSSRGPSRRAGRRAPRTSKGPHGPFE